jgi:hypothetical protein
MLFHEVERPVDSLPDPSNREAFGAYRAEWARPIFGLGMTDSPSHQLAGANLVSNTAVNTLSMLSGTLRSHTPEPRPVWGLKDLNQRLEDIYDKLGRIHVELSTTLWLDQRVRGRVLLLVLA